MSELVVPSDFGRAAFPDWFATYLSVSTDPDLLVRVPSEFDLWPSGIVAVCAVVAARAELGLQTRVQGTSNGLVTNSLNRLRMVGKPAEPAAHADPPQMMQIRPITDLREARERAEKIADALPSDIPNLSSSVLRMARFVMEELGANIVQHSGRARTGFAFARIGGNRKQLEIAFADAGVGFLTSLQRNRELAGRIADDAEALQLAISPRITGASSSRTNMGVGLKLLADFSDLLGADLVIASGSAMLHRKTAAGQRTNVLRSIPAWQGAWICLDAPLA